MIRGKNSDSISNDIIIEILLRLHVKSIVRFCCVSKRWRHMLHAPFFTDLFLTRSSAQPPHLLFAVFGEDGEWSFFSSPQPQNLYDDKSLFSHVVTAEFRMKLRKGLELCGHASGLIAFRQREDNRIMLCNPTTRQYKSLPLTIGKRKRRSLLGFDPIDKQFKVLSIRCFGYDKTNEPVQILTIGSREHYWWREIHCPLNHFVPDPYPEGICINGVLYYLGEQIDGLPSLIVCFDVRSEEFKFIYKDFISGWHLTKLINYKGKLSVITLKLYGSWCSFELFMWVIKDAEKPESSEWSKYFSTSWEGDECLSFSVVGITATSEIVLMKKYASKTSLYVFYLNPERNTRQCVEIRGFGEDFGRVKVFVDHVEDIKFIKIKKKKKTNINPQEQEALSIF